jgi:cytochrome c553
MRVEIPFLPRRWALAGALALAAVLPQAAHADPETLINTQCAGCHGPGGNSLVSMFPSLAGQPQAYLEKQLYDYFDGKRTNDIMSPVMAQMQRSEVAAVSAYYAGQKIAPLDPEPGSDALLEMGRRIYQDGIDDRSIPGCQGCHQADAKGAERYPRLFGQQRAYFVDQIKQFRSNQRTNDRARVMRNIAKPLTDHEISALAEYLATGR